MQGDASLSGAVDGAAVGGIHDGVGGQGRGGGQLHGLRRGSVGTGGSQGVLVGANHDFVAAGGEVRNLSVGGVVLEHEGGAGAGVGVDGVQDALRVHLALGGLDEHDAEQPTDFTGVNLLRVAVLGHILPQGVALEVVGGIGVHDADEVTTAAIPGEPAGLVVLEGTHSLANLVHGQVGRGGDTARIGGTGGELVGGVGNHGVAGHVVHDDTELLAEQFSGVVDDGVVGGQVEQVGDFHVRAVLGDGGLNLGLAEGLAGGGHALGELLSHLVGGEQGPATELDGLAVVPGDGPLLAELGVDELRLGPFEQGTVIPRFVQVRGRGCGVDSGLSGHRSFLL